MVNEEELRIQDGMGGSDGFGEVEVIWKQFPRDDFYKRSTSSDLIWCESEV
jgi:hypothetical protein